MAPKLIQCEKCGKTLTNAQVYQHTQYHLRCVSREAMKQFVE